MLKCTKRCTTLLPTLIDLYFSVPVLDWWEKRYVRPRRLDVGRIKDPYITRLHKLGPRLPNESYYYKTTDRKELRSDEKWAMDRYTL